MSILRINKVNNELQIFETVQGEGVFSGVPSFFIRLQGCSVRCFFCDEKKTWALGVSNENALSYKDILEKLQIINSELKRVVITGGEPTEQDIAPFISFLNSHGYKIALESAMSGEFAVPVLDYILETRKLMSSELFWLTFSPKAIYSEAGEPIDERVYALASEIKFVIAGDKAVNFLEEQLLPKVLNDDPTKPFFLVADWNNLEENQKRILILLRKYPRILRLGIQAHKYWGIA